MPSMSNIWSGGGKEWYESNQADLPYDRLLRLLGAVTVTVNLNSQGGRQGDAR